MRKIVWQGREALFMCWSQLRTFSPTRRGVVGLPWGQSSSPWPSSSFFTVGPCRHTQDLAPSWANPFSWQEHLLQAWCLGTWQTGWCWIRSKRLSRLDMEGRLASLKILGGTHDWSTQAWPCLESLWESHDSPSALTLPHFISISPHNTVVKPTWVALLSALCQWENWGSRVLNNISKLSKGTQESCQLWVLRSGIGKKRSFHFSLICFLTFMIIHYFMTVTSIYLMFIYLMFTFLKEKSTVT